ncbi:hypothetical protein GV829_12855 [Sphingomonas lacunae]|uniref:Uncharacterized protein n=1 Tax=Sphingomonas lacunae TaxID=2698828 RepID=A0A6M4AVT4_9SPHN|nr:hypothetical protein [Sphingomonas lacunae]QJQ33215.1 hypothetical protein GV829_12855 [Sphingomonas lacunae]
MERPFICRGSRSMRGNFESLASLLGNLPLSVPVFFELFATIFARGASDMAVIIGRTPAITPMEPQSAKKQPADHRYLDTMSRHLMMKAILDGCIR